MVTRPVMDNMAVMTRFIWRSVVLDKLSSIGCKSAKISIVGFCCSLVDVLVDPTLLQKPTFLHSVFGEGIVLLKVFFKKPYL
jgi:hypothetical protein